MSGIVTRAYGCAVYAFFLGAFVYAIAFVGDLPVPKTIDSGAAGGLVASLVVDAVLLTIFAVQHSVMARPAFKRWWTRFVPVAAERSTYVLFASLALVLLMGCWCPLPQIVWAVGGLSGAILLAIFWLGWIVLLISTFLISHFELFGVTQAFAGGRGHDPSPPKLKTPLFYRFVRHPIYLGFLLAFWAAPVMTVGHLVFAIATTGYILIGIWLEERDLVVTFGDAYRDYRQRVGMLAPRWSRRSKVASADRR